MGIELIRHDFKVAGAILSDTLFKKNFDKNKIEDIKLFKLLQAREDNIDFEMELAEMICGDNLDFPYRSSYFITKFFKDIGLNYTHNGSTRRFWMKDVLEELDIKKISYVIENGLFRKKDYKNPNFRNDKTREFNEDDFLSKAVFVFRKFIEDSICTSKPIDLAAVLDLNLNVELLFDRPAKTNDEALNKLIDEAKSRFLNPNDKQIALEKLWDAFERIKTYYSSDKKQSSRQLINNLSGDIDSSYFEDVFIKFTKIGNDYCIRHHETNKKEIKDKKSFDYLFFSMLNLLDLCLNVLNE